MRVLLCVAILVGLSQLVLSSHHIPEKSSRSRRFAFGGTLSLKAMFKKRQEDLQKAATGQAEVAQPPAARPPVDLIPPAPTPAPTAAPTESPEEYRCCPEFTKVGKKCIKIFDATGDDGPVTKMAAAARCLELPPYHEQEASLLSVSTNPNALENRFIVNESQGPGRLWISTQETQGADCYEIDRQTGEVSTQACTAELFYACEAAQAYVPHLIRKK